MSDDLERRAIIAAHDECGCDALNPGEAAIVALWRADRDDILRGAAANALTITARAEKAEAAIERVRALPAEHPSGGYYMVSMRDIRAALDGDEIS